MAVAHRCANFVKSPLTLLCFGLGLGLYVNSNSGDGWRVRLSQATCASGSLLTRLRGPHLRGIYILAPARTFGLPDE